MNRFAPEFVEGRRRALQRFLERCADHPLICTHATFHTFLHADNEKLAKAKADLTAQKKEDNGSMTSTKWLSNMVSMSSLSAAHVEKTDADLKIEEMSEYIQNLESQMQSVAKHTAILVKRGRDLASGLFEFGLAFTMLGHHETEALNGALAQMGHTADQLSLVAAEQVEKEQLSFEEPILDYIQMLAAVRQAISSRQECRRSYFMALGDVESKTGSLQRLKEAATPNEVKIRTAEDALSKAQDRETELKQVLADVSGRTLTEVQRFKHTKANDMRKVVLDYVQMQIEYNKRMEQQWALLVPEIESIQIERASAQTESPLPPSSSSLDAPPQDHSEGPALQQPEVNEEEDLVGV